jgi:CrcB protein
MLKLFIVGIGGFLGAMARYGLSGLVHRHLNGSFPTGTLAVNLAGCFLIGGLMCLVEERQFFTPETRVFLLIGFLGSFTTLSTVGYETFAFLRASDFQMAVVNAGVNMVCGVAAVALGWLGIKALGI